MANHKSGAQRYNDRMDKIFERAKQLQKECGSCHRLFHHELSKCPHCGKRV